MKLQRDVIPLLLLPLLALMASCSSDDGTTPAEDTDAPVVVQVDPAQGETDVALGEEVTIVFNEDMAAGSAAGNVAFSHGTITDQTWLDDKTLEISHDPWDEGIHVTVTAGTGLTDVAGNGLEQAFAWSFWTWTDDVVLLNTLPADGAVDVPINTQVWLQFSAGMDGMTLPGAITVSSPDKVDHAFTLDGDGDQWTLTFDADLPATTPITVTITTDAQDDWGNPLAAETSFGFTTGDAADTTPPNLIAVEPADGASIPVDTSYLRLTFDEPIDDYSLNPSKVSGQLMLAMENPDNAGVWSENQTVFTVALNPPLVPGAVFHVRFESFADLHGNVNDTPTEWTATVAGDADFFPVVDTFVLYYMGTWTDEVAKDSGWMQAATKYDVKTGGEFWRWTAEHMEFGPPVKQIPWEDYDRMKLTSTAVQFLGFYEADEGGDKQGYEVTFDPPVQWLRNPIPAAGYTHEGDADFLPEPGPGEPDRVDYSVTVDETVYEVEMPFDDKQGSPPVFWMGCRKAVVTYEVSDGLDVFSSGTDEIWYCPGIGPVRKVSEEMYGFQTYYTTLDLVWGGLEENFPD
jgi:hypothetical protein